MRFLRFTITALVTLTWATLLTGMASCAVERHRVKIEQTRRQVDEYNRSIAETEPIIVRERQILQAEKR